VQTGASKHYAYVEMSSKSVAEIVAETMNNYLMMGHLLKCEVRQRFSSTSSVLDKWPSGS
jgi:RNA recognition motif-containing protein